MIHKSMAPQCGQVQVTFELPSCLWADRIVVTGDFNNWSHTATPMRQGRDGVWRASVILPAGSHFEFRYLIDGQWQTDYHADGSTTTEFGSENSIVDTNLFELEITEQPAPSSLPRESVHYGALVPPPTNKRKLLRVAA